MNVFEKLVDFSYKKDISICNLTNDFFALLVNKIFKDYDKNILIVTPNLYEAKKLFSIINRYIDCFLFEVDDLSLVNVDATSPILKTERLSILNSLINSKKNIVITDLLGCLKYLPSKDVYVKSFVKLYVGEEINLSDLVSKLVDIGYNREELVIKMGDFAVRGYILDIFLIDSDYPIRVEFFGDEIESIRYFNPDSQRSISDIDNITIYPFGDINSSNVNNITSYMGDCFTIFKDFNQIKLAYERLLEEVTLYNDGVRNFFDFDDLKFKDVIYYNDFDNYFDGDNFLSYGAKSIGFIGNDFGAINDYINKKINNGKTIVICISLKNKNNFFDIFNSSYVITDFNNLYDNKINIVDFDLGEGFLIDNYVFLSEKELFNKSTVRRKHVKFRYSKKISDLNKLQIGDYVVHESCGIGIYNGIKTLTKNGILGDYVEILYANSDKLYIPASKIELISKFSSKEGYVPKINSLNSGAWEKAKARVRNKIKYEAERLIRVHAQRKLKKGFAFSRDNELQVMFENEFIYSPTEDQLKASLEIKGDMEKDSPMDRLLCGDVGYGKTEVAFRAIFKAVLDNKQVMYLCPTTLLSRQQYLSALSRFSNYPVRIELLNRFVSSKNAKIIIDDFNNGKIDVLFGTHRILSDDVKAKDLGLLVIDEEQRFGVAHKEKIKEYKSSIDVLTLTATPIPRTLQMAIFGLKDLSLIETPPKDRHAIQTYVVSYDKNVVRDIIYREMARDGQVFILYNKVEDIELKVREIEMLVPDARVIFAHGQMSKVELENRMNDFINYKYDVLLCTTIIETGVDIPNVNTLIVLNADRFGLSQLYQIRGRVGRSDRIAYAYLMYDKNKVLTENAIKRLDVLKDFTELGSGFSIAARDLSIRGFGDILGSDQAGYIDSVGIDLYMKLLNEEMLRLKGHVVEDESISQAVGNVEVNNHIDAKYVGSDGLRIEIHKLINSIDSYQRYDEVFCELSDRFGKLDDDLILYMNKELFENYGKKLGISKIFENNNYVEVMFNSVKSSSIDYESLIVDSLKISKRFIFSYKNNSLYIKILKVKDSEHPIILFNKLFEKI